MLEYLILQKQSSRGMFCKKAVLRNFSKCTGKHLREDTLPQVFSCEFCESSKNAFPYETRPLAASVFWNWGGSARKHL